MTKELTLCIDKVHPPFVVVLYLVQTKHIVWSTIVVILFSDLKMQSQPISYKHDAFKATVAQEIELSVSCDRKVSGLKPCRFGKTFFPLCIKQM